MSRLRARSHRANFDEAEAECTERIDVAPVLVEARGKADAIRKPQAEESDCCVRILRGCANETQRVRALERGQCKCVGVLWWKREEQWAQQRVDAKGQVTK